MQAVKTRELVITAESSLTAASSKQQAASSKQLVMSNQTPRIDPSQISNTKHSVFRIVAKVLDQPQPTELILQSPTTNGEMLTLSQVKLSQGSNIEVGSWYEFVCRSVDTGDVGLMVLDSVKCELKEGEEISVSGIVALQQLSGKFPDLY